MKYTLPCIEYSSLNLKLNIFCFAAKTSPAIFQHFIILVPLRQPNRQLDKHFFIENSTLSAPNCVIFSHFPRKPGPSHASQLKTS